MKTLTLSLLALGCFLVAGCSGEKPKTAAEEKKAFLGGPMPADFAKKQGEIMKEKMANAAAEAQKAQNGNR